MAALHGAAWEIVRCCGVSPLKAHRWAWGWTLEQAIGAFHDMCAAEDLGTHALSLRSWQMWEAGAATSDRYQNLLCRLFRTSGLALGFTPDYTPRVPTGGMADGLVEDPAPPLADLNWRRSIDERLSDLDERLAAVQAAVAGLPACALDPGSREPTPRRTEGDRAPAEEGFGCT